MASDLKWAEMTPFRSKPDYVAVFQKSRGSWVNGLVGAVEI